MSYPALPPLAPAPVATPAPAGRPPVVSFAAVLLWAMAAVGLIYAIATLAVVPGTVDRFRSTSGTAFRRFSDVNNDPESFIAVVWLGAAVALAVAVILFALYVVLGIALRRGSNAARIATLVVCAAGALAGIGTIATVAVERSGNALPGSLGQLLTTAYPSGWIGVNITLAILQVLAYALVGVLVLAAPRAFFRRGGTAEAVPAMAGAPQYGLPYPSGYPASAGYPGAPGYAPASAPPAPGYLPASAPPAPGYMPASAPPAPGGYGPASSPPAGFYGPPPAAGYGPGAAAPGAYGPPAPGGYGPASAPGHGPAAPGSYGPASAPGGYGPPAPGGYGPASAPSGYGPDPMPGGYGP
ncbi:hypothetical protein, partial [Paractinoplanes rishiriensis]|uniref:hypothetical protein n=1 Tax=Paractinoplanes rishiriensis TaxID=1050105 RepID=UPI001943DAEA